MLTSTARYVLVSDTLYFYLNITTTDQPITITAIPINQPQIVVNTLEITYLTCGGSPTYTISGENSDKLTITLTAQSSPVPLSTGIWHIHLSLGSADPSRKSYTTSNMAIGACYGDGCVIDNMPTSTSTMTSQFSSTSSTPTSASNTATTSSIPTSTFSTSTTSIKFTSIAHTTYPTVFVIIILFLYIFMINN